MHRPIWVITLVLLTGCGGPEKEADEQRLSAAQMLGSNNIEGFLRATEPRRFSFPTDHGPHAGFRNEWWYLTGNLETQEGRRFGYQVTLFSTALRPEGDNPCAETSRWCTNRIWMGHAAVSDVANNQHVAQEVFSRQEPGLAGARLDPFRVWLQDWQLFSVNNGFPWELEVITDNLALTLTLSPEKAPVLQGNNGLSQKSPDPGNASYYYSMTRIATFGQVSVNGDRYEVSGSTWLDREWSTSALASDQSGWDWFSLQLNDGSELMYYQLRDLEGNAHPNSGGNLTSLMNTQTAIAPDEMTLEELEGWDSPDGTRYTTQWRMRIRENDWIIRAVFEDQLMDVTFQYWEGAVDVLDTETNERVGQGYLEMVR